MKRILGERRLAPMRLGGPPPAGRAEAQQAAAQLARRGGRDVFVTQPEDGLLAASPDGLVTSTRGESPLM